MKLLQVLGHNSKWNIDSYIEQKIGDEFLITAFSFGENYLKNKRINLVQDRCMLDLQFYGQKRSGSISKGKLTEFIFHPANFLQEDIPTNVCMINCIKNAIQYQIDRGFKKVIIPHYYEDDFLPNIISIIKVVNKFLLKNKKEDVEYYMTIPFAYDIIRDSEKVDELLFNLTDMDILFDGYYIVCENKPEQGHKLTIDNKLINNLSRVFCVLKNQCFKTIYAYSNWDAILYLAQSDIDYISIGTYENLRNFSIKRFTEDISGGASDGYYFSEKLLNMVRAKDLINIRNNRALKLIKNEKNIFSDIILQEGYMWNIHKPDVNKNYLLSISKILNNIATIDSIRDRILYVLIMIQNSIENYKKLEENYIELQREGQNYHLSVWKMHLLKSIQMKPDEFNSFYQSEITNK